MSDTPREKIVILAQKAMLSAGAEDHVFKEAVTAELVVTLYNDLLQASRELNEAYERAAHICLARFERIKMGIPSITILTMFDELENAAKDIRALKDTPNG